MAKSKRKLKARNKIEASREGELIKGEPVPINEPATAYYRSQTVAVTRSTQFTAEFEAVIEIIARERVYRAMLDRLGRRLLTGSSQTPDEPRRISES